MSKVILGDCLEVMKGMGAGSVDLICTDPPYGYSFMGKDWDRAVPGVEVWQECLRVLKPGAFCFVMSAPRSDVQMHMVQSLSAAGFRLDFTPIYWTYASGFPKAGNVGKRTGKPELKGAYAGFQPKPAVEVIIVAMKPLSEKTFVDQALKNSKGVTWLDNCRIPTNGEEIKIGFKDAGMKPEDGWNDHNLVRTPDDYESPTGRFPANLLVSDDVLNDGRVSSSKRNEKPSEALAGNTWGGTIQTNRGARGHTDSGSYSRYFDLDRWAQTLPFLIVPKASKSEKNRGLDSFEDVERKTLDGGDMSVDERGKPGTSITKNHHPTVKPLKLMSYLITLGSREGDTVLDPFCGSGTTCLAAKKLKRNPIGIEREEEYVEIARARLDSDKQGVLL